MPFPLAGLGIGALVGLAKSLTVDRAVESADRRRNAELMRVSPWSGIKPGVTARANPFRDITAGALGGAEFQQGLDRRSKYLGEGRSPGVSTEPVAKDVPGDPDVKFTVDTGLDRMPSSVPEVGMHGLWEMPDGLPSPSPWYGMSKRRRKLYDWDPMPGAQEGIQDITSLQDEWK